MFFFLLFYFFLLSNCKNILNIRILTMNRPNSLNRLLQSLLHADYCDDIINIEFFVDAQPNSNLIDKKTENIINHFQWKVGSKKVFLNRINAGLKKQWMKYYNESVPFVMIEDDIKVSKDFYKISKKILKFLEPEDTSNIFGISLQNLHLLLKNERCSYFNARYCSGKFVKLNQTFLIPQMSSWAPIVFAKKFNQLIRFYEKFEQQQTFVPCIPGAITNKWLDTAGTFMQYFFYINNYFMIYFNIEKYIIMNFREKGEHFNRNEGFEELEEYDYKKDTISLTLNDYYDHSLKKIKYGDNFSFDQSIQNISNIEKKCIYFSETSINTPYIPS